MLLSTPESWEFDVPVKNPITVCPFVCLRVLPNTTGASPASALITPTLTPHPAIITSVGSSLMLTCALGNTRHPQHVGYRWFFEHFKLGGGQEELTAHSVHKRGGHLSLLTKTVKSVQQTGAYTCQIRLPVNINMTISTIVKVVGEKAVEYTV